MAVPGVKTADANIDDVFADVAPSDLADKARVSGFSDNVISIAITLLVLGVVVPGTWTSKDHPVLAFAPVLKYLAPRLLSFVLSFAIVGVYWVAHHQMFRSLQRIGRPVLWINNLFLMTITLIPASAGILSEYPGQTVSVVIYGVNVVMSAASLLMLWHYGVRFHRSHGVEIDPMIARVAYVRTGGGLIVYLIGLPLAFLSPWTGLAIYAVVPLMYIVLQARPIASDSPARARA